MNNHIHEHRICLDHGLIICHRPTGLQ